MTRPGRFLHDGVGTREHRLSPCGGSAEDLERLLRRQAVATGVFLQQLPHGVGEQRGVRAELTEQLLPEGVPVLLTDPRPAASALGGQRRPQKACQDEKCESK